MSAAVDSSAETVAGTPERTGGEPARRRPWVRRVLLASVGVVVLLVLAAGWLAFCGYQAVTALRDARSIVSGLQADVNEGSTQRIAAQLPAAQASLDRARRATDDPLWRAAGFLPVMGDDLRAVRTVSHALDDTVRTSLPAVNRIGAVLDAQRAPGTTGRIDLAPLVDAAPDIQAAATVAARASAQVAAIDTTSLVHPLARPVTQVQVAMHEVSSALDTGAQVATLLPGMLGADGPRTYVLVSLNSSELRSAGGIVGAFASLHADAGKIDLVDQRSTLDFPHTDAPILPLTADELATQTDLLGRYVSDATLTPDFPRTAQLVAAWWQRQVGQQVDGVIAVDPLAAQFLLEAIGPVAVPGGPTVTADTLLPTLLHDSYLTYRDPAANDGFYDRVAAAIFQAAGSGQGGNERGVVDALARAGTEGRLRIWSAHPDEQRRIATTTVGAAFLSGRFGDDAGVFLDDATAGKLDYYLHTEYAISMRCTGPNPSATVRVALTYLPPADVATYPEYVTGFNLGSIPVGSIATRVSVYAPVGANLDAIGLDGGFVSGQTATVAGRRMQAVAMEFAPGGHATYTFTVPVRDSQVDVWTTPTVTSAGHLHATCG